MKIELLSKLRDATYSEIYEAVYTDPLTGLLNRRALEASRHLAVAIVDLDSLKYINDNYGHRQGDAHLVHLGTLLSFMFGHGNVYRLGGDEIVITGPKPHPLSSALRRSQATHGRFSYGVGTSLATADARLKDNKKHREMCGLRSPRGEAPPWDSSTALTLCRVPL